MMGKARDAGRPALRWKCASKWSGGTVEPGFIARRLLIAPIACRAPSDSLGGLERNLAHAMFPSKASPVTVWPLDRQRVAFPNDLR